MADDVLVIEARLKNLISGELDKLRNDFKKTGKSGSENFKKINTSFKSVAKGAAAFVGVTTAIDLTRRTIANVVKTSTDFESSMSRIKAILKPTTGEFGALSDKAQELGRTTVFTASQTADAFKNLGQLGLNTNQILQSSEGVLSLAAAAQIDMATAAEVTANTLANFQMKASESTTVVDVMAKSFNISALDMTRFSESMKFVGPLAGSLNVSLETTTAALAALSKQGLTGSLAGTGLRFTMSQLAQESTKAGKAIGVTVNDTRTFVEKLQDVKDLGLTSGQVMELFGERAGNVANILLNNIDVMGDFNEELVNAKGTSEEMAETMQDNAKGAFKKLESASEGLAINIGKLLNPALESSAELLAKAANKASNFLDSMFQLSNATQIQTIKKQIDNLNESIEVISDPSKRNLIEKVVWGAQGAEFAERTVTSYTERIKELQAELIKLQNPESDGDAPVKTGGGSGDDGDGSGTSLSASDDEMDRLFQQTDIYIEQLQRQKDAFKFSESMRTEIAIEEAEKRQEVLERAAEFEDRINAQRVSGLEFLSEMKEQQDARQTESETMLFDAKKKLMNAGFSLTKSILASNAKENKKAAKAMKAVSIAQASINTFLAASKANTATPYPPVNAVLMATAIAQGLAQVVAISSQKLQTGGIVDGPRTPVDAVSISASGGEMMLTGADQRNLLNTIRGNNTGGKESPISLNLTFQGPVDQNTLPDIQRSVEELGNTFKMAVQSGVIDFNEYPELVTTSTSDDF